MIDFWMNLSSHQLNWEGSRWYLTKLQLITIYFLFGCKNNNSMSNNREKTLSHSSICLEYYPQIMVASLLAIQKLDITFQASRNITVMFWLLNINEREN